MSKPLDLYHQNPEIAELKEALDADIRLALSLHRDYTAPYLAALTDATRNIVSLSAGAIIASASVAQFVREKIPVSEAGWLLPLSWSLFALAIVAGLIRINGLHSASGSILKVLYSRGSLLDAVDSCVTVEAARAQAMEHRIMAHRAAMELSAASMRGDTLLAWVTSLSFFFGLLALVVFAAVDLAPWQ